MDSIDEVTKPIKAKKAVKVGGYDAALSSNEDSDSGISSLTDDENNPRYLNNRRTQGEFLPPQEYEVSLSSEEELELLEEQADLDRKKNEIATNSNESKLISNSKSDLKHTAIVQNHNLNKALATIALDIADKTIKSDKESFLAELSSLEAQKKQYTDFLQTSTVDTLDYSKKAQQELVATTIRSATNKLTELDKKLISVNDKEIFKDLFDLVNPGAWVRKIIKNSRKAKIKKQMKALQNTTIPAILTKQKTFNTNMHAALKTQMLANKNSLEKYREALDATKDKLINDKNKDSVVAIANQKRTTSLDNVFSANLSTSSSSSLSNASQDVQNTLIALEVGMQKNRKSRLSRSSSPSSTISNEPRRRAHPVKH